MAFSFSGSVVIPLDDSVSKIPYFFLEEADLTQIELQAIFSEPLEHFPRVGQVLLERASNHDHIQVHKS
jgi:hypothetical protein